MSNLCIFVGSIYPDKTLNDIICEGSHADFAAHNFQSGIIEGLHIYYDKMNIITSPVTSSYPKSKKLYYKSTEFEVSVSDKKINAFFSGFINLPFIKLVSEFINIRRSLKNFLDNKQTVYIYALHSPFLLAVYSLRKQFSKVCVIIPDLPDYMSNNKGVIRRFLKYVNKKIINKCLKTFQYDVLFSKFMANKLPVDNKRWIVVEGMYDVNEIPKIEKENSKTILYTGIISSHYGVFDLIEAFHSIHADDYQLWLCGSCIGEIDKLNSYIGIDKRIKYLGMLKKDEVRVLQVKATLLVNPRHSTEEFTKYSFPSKTFEYLASGTPTLMCKLPAIPDEYLDHLFFFNDESIDGFKNRIIEICEMDCFELKKKGELARDFILNKKNCYSQAKKIVNLVESD